MITLYGVLKFVHLVGAAIWLGSNATTLALRVAAVRTGDRSRTIALIRETDQIQRLVVSPAVALLIAAGIWLVLEGGWGFDRLFVVAGLAGVAVSAIFGTLVTLPATRRLGRATAANEGGSARFGPLITRIQLALAFDLVLVTAVVFVMVTKPSL